MEIGELFRRSGSVYKRRLMAMAIPFLLLFLLMLTISFVFATPASLSFQENENLRKVEKGTVFFSGFNPLDELDENYLEIIPENEPADNCWLEIWHESNPVPQVQLENKWFKVVLVLKSGGLAFYQFDLYNFAENRWENRLKGWAKNDRVNAEISTTENVEDYLSEENTIRLRVLGKGENIPSAFYEDCLMFDVYDFPNIPGIAGGYLAIFLGLVLCFGIVIASTWSEFQEEKAPKSSLKLAIRRYPEVLLGMLLFIWPFLLSILLMLLGYGWAVFLMSLSFLYLLFCGYVPQSALTGSFSPIRNLEESFKATWKNPGTTFLLWFMMMVVWMVSEYIPLVGLLILTLFLSWWVVALSLVYLDTRKSWISDQVEKS